MNMNKILITLMLLTNAAHCYTAEEIVTLTILGESRCQQEEGMRAVGQVLLNRSRANNIPVDAVCLKTRQFSCWNNKKAMLRRSEAVMAEFESKTRLAQSIAAFICNNMDVHETRANHYWAHNLCDPYWAKGKAGVIIGDHTFIQL